LCGTAFKYKLFFDEAYQMQFYGLDKQNLVLASNANRGQVYVCPECQTALRIRGGPHRQTHFYHLQRPQNCRQHQKSLPHLLAQKHIQNLLPEGESLLERPFTSIGRIADVTWESKKIIFEIQCSPISRDEVQARNRDYASQGWTVVWILHDKRFNKKNLGAAEHYLRQTLCYFTNIDDSGNGMIYDQFDVHRKMGRIFTSPPLKVSVYEPKTNNNSIYFKGDRTDRRLLAPPNNPLLKKLQIIENELEGRVRPIFLIGIYVKRFYNSLFCCILEKLTD
jgi:competence protein CoiA